MQPSISIAPAIRSSKDTTRLRDGAGATSIRSPSICAGEQRRKRARYHALYELVADPAGFSSPRFEMDGIMWVQAYWTGGSILMAPGCVYCAVDLGLLGLFSPAM